MPIVGSGPARAAAFGREGGQAAVLTGLGIRWISCRVQGPVAEVDVPPSTVRLPGQDLLDGAAGHEDGLGAPPRRLVFDGHDRAGQPLPAGQEVLDPLRVEAHAVDHQRHHVAAHSHRQHVRKVRVQVDVVLGEQHMGGVGMVVETP